MNEPTLDLMPSSGIRASADTIRASRSLLAAQPIGELLVLAGHLAPHQIDLVLFKQRKEGLLFGEAAIRLGLVTAEQVEQALLLQYSAAGVSVGSNSNLHPSLAAALRPHGSVAEAVRALRSQLRLRWFIGARKALAVLGLSSGDGCSTIAANLAISFTHLGKRVALVDANLRRPVLSALFQVKMGVGLSSLLANRIRLSDALIDVWSVPGLALLPACPLPPNPQELLSSGALRTVIDELTAQHDVLIIDGSALLVSADAQLIASEIGACVLTIRRHRARFEQIEKARELLSPPGCACSVSR